MSTGSATPTISMSDAAVERLRALLADNGDPEAGLRVEVIPGGCSGFEYAMALEPAREGDEVVGEEGARVYVDRFSLPYLLGVQLDYEESFQGAGFLINNPNASASCGCGKSFST